MSDDTNERGDALFRSYPALGRHYLTSMAVHSAVDLGLSRRLNTQQIADMAIEALVSESAAYQGMAGQLMANQPSAAIARIARDPVTE